MAKHILCCLIGGLLTTGCDAVRLHEVAVSVGLLDASKPGPRNVAIVAIPNIASSASQLDEELRAVLDSLKDRAGSSVTAYRSGDIDADLAIASPCVIPADDAIAIETKDGNWVKFKESCRATTLNALFPDALKATPFAQARIAAAIAEASRSHPSEIIVLSDGREFDGEHQVCRDERICRCVEHEYNDEFDCDACVKKKCHTNHACSTVAEIDLDSNLSTFARVFATWLSSQHLLQPGSLKGINVHFAFFGLQQHHLVRGTHQQSDIEVLTDLWRSAVQQAGGRYSTSPGAVHDFTLPVEVAK
jgi:hypothetical protein